MTPATIAPAGGVPRPARLVSPLAGCGAVMLTVSAYIFAFGQGVAESIGDVLNPPVGGAGQGDPMGWMSVGTFALLTVLGLLCGLIAVLAALVAVNRIDDLLPVLREWFVGIPKPRPGTGLIAAGAALVLQLGGIGLSHVFHRATDSSAAASPASGSISAAAAFGSLAGFSEELIVLALPLTVARILAPRSLRGWRLVALVVILAVARLLFHLYQGWDAVLMQHVLWAPGMVLVYLWCRRVWPLIVQHAAFNLSLLPLNHGWWASHAWAAGAVVTAAVLLGSGLWLRGRRTALAGSGSVASS